MKVTIVPVTPFQQNCSVLVCEATSRCAIVDPGGDLDLIEDAVWKVRHNMTSQIHGAGAGGYARANGAATIAAGSQTAVTLKEGQYQRFVKGDKYVAASYVAPGSYGSSQRTLRTADVDVDTV